MQLAEAISFKNAQICLLIGNFLQQLSMLNNSCPFLTLTYALFEHHFKGPPRLCTCSQAFSLSLEEGGVVSDNRDTPKSRWRMGINLGGLRCFLGTSVLNLQQHRQSVPLCDPQSPHPLSSSYHLTTPQNNHYHVSPCPRLSRDSKTRHKHQHFSSSIQPEKDEQVPSKLTGYRPKSFSFSTTPIERPGCFRISVLAEASPTIPPPTMTISNELKRKQVL